MLIFFFIVIFILLYYFYRYIYHSTKIDPCGKYVLISGCDTGIGHETAMKLDEEGFHVFAGVLLPTNVTALQSKLSSRATVFPLDITQQDDIDRAFCLVRTKTATLHGLVNNAGILTHGPVDWTSREMMRRMMNVNFFGHVALTKTFLPLLISRGDCRVVNVVSAAGFFSFPNTSAYSTSKHAMKSFSDCLRREMFPWNLRVAIIEPGALKTSMLDAYERTWRNLWNELSADVQQRWGIDYLNQIITRSINSPFMRHADNPRRVVGAVQHALTSTTPWLRYRPGWQAKLFFYVLYLPPAWIIDLLLDKALNFRPSSAQHQLTN